MKERLAMVGLYVNLYQLRAFVPIAARAGQAQVIFGRVATGRQRNNVLNFRRACRVQLLETCSTRNDNRREMLPTGVLQQEHVSQSGGIREVVATRL